MRMLNNEEGVSGSLNRISLSQLGWRRVLDVPAEEEEAPTYLNTFPNCPFLVISTDKLSAQYTGEAQHGYDVGAIQGNCPAPVRKLLYYFEIYVKDKGLKGNVSIGFTDAHFKLTRQTGWEPNSFGYHGDDGFLYHGHGKGESFGPKFTTGDTVGAGINYASQTIFFTKNGKFVGSTPKDVKGSLFPTIGLHSPNEKVDVNFGQRAFVFDIEQLAQEEREKRQAIIEKVSLPLSVSHWIVRSYLLHYGYKETLASFDTASGNTFPPVLPTPQENNSLEIVTYALDERKILRQLIRNGDIDSAFKNLRDWYPEVVKDDMSTICFLLHCQKYIELVTKGMLESAVTYARSELSRFFGVKYLSDLLQDCVALLAYEEPAKSSVGYLLSLAQRELVADAVNNVVLSTNPALQNPECCLQSSLERLLRQLRACCLERRLLNGGQGEIFCLHKMLHGGKEGSW